MAGKFVLPVLTIPILAAVAEHEAGMISGRTTVALAAAKAGGTTLRAGARPPLRRCPVGFAADVIFKPHVVAQGVDKARLPILRVIQPAVECCPERR
jgi:hypothetical protein